MAATKTRAARMKMTKDDLVDEMIAVEKRLAGEPVLDSTASQLAKEAAAEVRAHVKGLSVDAIVEAGAKFGLDVQRVVAGLTEQAVAKATELKTLQDAITIETAELERLYEVDIAETSIFQLIEEHRSNKGIFAQETEAVRLNWDAECQQHLKTVAERNAQITADRAREQAEYDYRTKQARSRESEEWTHQMATTRRVEKERSEIEAQKIQNAWGEVRKVEADLTAANERYSNIDAEIKKAVDAAVAIATNSVKKDLTTGFAIEKKDLETKILLSDQRNTQLSTQNQQLIVEMSKLQGKLDDATQRVQTIAQSAVEGASGHFALTKVLEVKHEQAQPRSKT